MKRRWKIMLGVMGAFVAAPGNGEPLASRKVSYADLDLGRETDVDRLRRRVRSAASSLCHDATRDSIVSENLVRLCFNDTMEGANRQIAQLVQASRSTSKMAQGTALILIRAK